MVPTAVIDVLVFGEGSAADLGRTLDSVATQTCSPRSVAVLGGKPEETAETMVFRHSARFIAGDPPATWADLFAAAGTACDGPRLAFLPCGDVWHPQCLELLARRLDGHADSAMACGWTLDFWSDGEIRDGTAVERPFDLPRAKQFPGAMLVTAETLATPLTRVDLSRLRVDRALPPADGLATVECPDVIYYRRINRQNLGRRLDTDQQMSLISTLRRAMSGGRAGVKRRHRVGAEVK